MQRFDLIRETARAGAHMSECSEGEFVRYNDALRAAADRANETAREHERFVNALYAQMKNDNFDDAYDMVKDMYRAIHGPAD